MILGVARWIDWLLSRVRGAGVWLSVATLGLCIFGSFALAGSAAAALPPGCSEVASTVTCSFSSTGAAQSFTVPAGVNSITVAAFGGQGGGSGGAGGLGGEAQGVFAVAPGAAVEVLVGGQGGTSTGVQASAAGGFNGGGDGGDGGPGPFPGFGSGAGGSGGGGASDVRMGTCASSLSCGLAARALVGGGGGGVSASSASGGGGGSPSGDSGTSDQGGGGGGGSQSVGGSGGAGGSDITGCAGGNGTDGGAATQDSGGAGGAGGSTPGPLPGLGGPGAGGGGGGYWGGGGGGGGCDSAGTGGSGGGGGGSSFGPADATFTDATQSGDGMVTISYVAGAAHVSSSWLSFSSQAQSTISAPQTVTVTNTGLAPLVVTGMTFVGTDPQDYLITSNGCLGPIAAGASCMVGVAFAPQEQGASSAMLQISSNDPNGPASVSLSGTGGQLPEGPIGPPGPTGLAGATGAQGPAGQIELVVCRTVTKKRTKHGRKSPVKVKKCTTRLVSGTVKFTIASHAVEANVSRAGVTCATGRAIPTGTGQWELMLIRRIDPLRPGRYILTLRSPRGGRRVLERTAITIT